MSPPVKLCHTEYFIADKHSMSILSITLINRRCKADSEGETTLANLVQVFPPMENRSQQLLPFYLPKKLLQFSRIFHYYFHYREFFIFLARKWSKLGKSLTINLLFPSISTSPSISSPCFPLGG